MQHGRFLPLEFGVLAILLGLAGCTTEPYYPVAADEPLDHEIYVINYAWHTGIVLARRDLPAGRIPEAEDFPDAAYLEFGWGDRKYYPARDPGIGQALAAGLIPTDSVVQVAGLPRSPQDYYASAEVHAFPVTSSGILNLVEQLHAVFDRDDKERADVLHISASERMRYYPAHGRFHLFNTCNTWTARKLAAAGLPISAGGVITAEQLMRRVRRLTESAQVSLMTPPPVKILQSST
jgi:uncharacterized protein (TIGR02117 family)